MTRTATAKPRRGIVARLRAIQVSDRQAAAAVMFGVTMLCVTYTPMHPVLCGIVGATVALLFLSTGKPAPRRRTVHHRTRK
jgi:hypothetical protein